LGFPLFPRGKRLPSQSPSPLRELLSRLLCDRRRAWGGLAPLLLYGGGLGKGIVVGRSSRDGGQPASDPVTIPDLVGTITRSLLDLSEVRLLDSLPKSLQATLSQGRPIPGLG
jgi:hypothetical protein